MMEKEDSFPRVLGPETSLLLRDASSLARRPTPIALAIPTATKRPVAAEADKRVVDAVTVETPAAVVEVVSKTKGRTAKAGAARAKATMRTLYILMFSL